jgi:hypothetical protein
VSISSKEAWLDGPGDLAEAIVEDVPVKGASVKVRGLPAAFSNQAQSEALKLVTGARGEQSATVDTARMSILQFAHGCVEPKFTVDEAEKVAQKFGPAFNKVIEKIDELSGVDKEAIADANKQFRSGVEEPGDIGPVESDGSATAGSGPVVSGGTGA